MNWKDISKSSYTVESAKFTLARPSHPFTIPYQGPKVVYSEGDELSSVADYRFNLDFTSDPLGPNHFPCGYWHKNYIPPFTIIYTSCPYPVEFGDGILSTAVSLVEGNFRDIYQYGYGVDSIEGTYIALVSGTFRTTSHVYTYIEGIESTSISISSGIFRDIAHDYSLRDSIESTAMSISSGIFKDIVIEYNFWPAEGIEDLGILIVSGSHGN